MRHILLCLSLLLSCSLFGQTPVSDLNAIYSSMHRALKSGNLMQADSLARRYEAACAPYVDYRSGFHYSECLHVQASYMMSRGEFSEAMELLDRVIVLRQKPTEMMGPDMLAVTYLEKSQCLARLSRLDDAIGEAQKASDIFQKGGYKDGYASAELELARYCQMRDGSGDEASSFQHYLNASKYVKKGTDKYVKCMDGLAQSYARQGKETEVQKVTKGLDKMAAKIYGAGSTAYAKFLTKTAQVNMAINHDDAALLLAEKAIGIYAGVGKSGDIDYAKLLMTTAKIHKDAQQYDKVIALLEEARPILLQKEGKDGRYYTDCLSQLAEAYGATGKSDKQQDIIHEVKSVIASTDSVVSTRARAGQLVAQAISLMQMGNYSEAIDMTQHALQIYAQRSDSTGLAQGYTLMVKLHTSQGNVAQADSLLSVAYGISERNKLYDCKAELLHLMANSCCAKGNYSEALTHCDASLSLLRDQEKALSSEYAKIQSDKGHVFYSMKDYRSALAATSQALATLKAVRGEMHQDVVMLLYNVAVYHQLLGEADSMALYLHKAIELQTGIVRNNFSLLSAKQRELYWNTANYVFKDSPVFVADPKLLTPSIVRDVYNAQLFMKGLLLNNEVDFRKLLLKSASKSVRDRYDKLLEMYKQLQQYYSSSNPDDQRLIPSLCNEISEAEHYVVKACKEFGDFTQNLTINIDSVSRSLLKGEAAVELVEATVNETDRVYLALIMCNGWQTPRVCRLFSQSEYYELSYPRQDISATLSDSTMQNRIFHDVRLGRMVWDPIIEALKDTGTEKLYISPTGPFYQWAIEYMPCREDGTRATELMAIRRLSSTKLLAQGRSSFRLDPDVSCAVIYGGMDYDLSVGAMKEVVEEKEWEQEMEEIPYYACEADYGMEEADMMGAVRAGNNLPEPLPGAMAEADSLDYMLEVARIRHRRYAYSGVEESFKAMSGQDISLLHVATHGFCMPEPGRSEASAYSYLGMSHVPEADNSLCFSGLFFSGCNNVLRGGRLGQDMENGILTAQEISGLNLQGVQLTVLSACQTGLGTLKDDGVFGLQRGFKKAGAKTLVMSLWSVNDQATSLMMREFYGGLLSGMTRHNAFLNAQNAVRQVFPSPHYWASFIMLDDI